MSAEKKALGVLSKKLEKALTKFHKTMTEKEMKVANKMEDVLDEINELHSKGVVSKAKLASLKKTVDAFVAKVEKKGPVSMVHVVYVPKGIDWEYTRLPKGWVYSTNGKASATQQYDSFGGPKASVSQMKEYLSKKMKKLKEQGAVGTYSIRSTLPKTISGGGITPVSKITNHNGHGVSLGATELGRNRQRTTLVRGETQQNSGQDQTHPFGISN